MPLAFLRIRCNIRRKFKSYHKFSASIAVKRLRRMVEADAWNMGERPPVEERMAGRARRGGVCGDAAGRRGAAGAG
jgi:hypothetical protein